MPYYCLVFHRFIPKLFPYEIQKLCSKSYKYFILLFSLMYFICNNKYQLSLEHSEDIQRLNSSSALFRCVLLSYSKGDETIPPPLQGPAQQNINAGSTQCNRRASGLPRIQTLSIVNVDFHPPVEFCEAPLFSKEALILLFLTFQIFSNFLPV